MPLPAAAANPIIPGVIAAALYLAGALLHGRALAHNAGKMSVRLLAALAAPAMALHGFAVYAQVNVPGGFGLGLLSVASLTALVMVVLVMLMSVLQPVRSLLVVLFPISAAALLASLFAPGRAAPIDASDAGLATHILTSILAYSILMMAALQSIFVGIVERSIRVPTHLALLRILPPLETMERLLFVMVWTGFITLTAAIGSGFLYLDDMFAQHVVHHTVLSSASWLAYALLLAGRLWFGWRGVSAVRWILVAFVLLLLGYLGSKFVLEILLERS